LSGIWRLEIYRLLWYGECWWDCVRGIAKRLILPINLSINFIQCCTLSHNSLYSKSVKLSQWQIQFVSIWRYQNICWIIKVMTVSRSIFYSLCEECLRVIGCSFNAITLCQLKSIKKFFIANILYILWLLLSQSFFSISITVFLWHCCGSEGKALNFIT
jgi:hypothetical protein